MNDLLQDPIIRTRLSGGTTEKLSLPALYSVLMDDQVESQPALRPHQRHAWHAFLAQLAAIALHRAGKSEFPVSTSDWASLLRNLTREYDDNEPWCFVVSDAERPALLQPPAPDGIGSYKKSIDYPDDLDLLVTAKNHDIKQSIAIGGELEDWLFALVTLQTMSGFLGAGNYGIARMNGGFSSRPCLGLVPADGKPGSQLKSDVLRMLSGRTSLLEDFAPYFQAQDGLALLWLEPWDGKTSLDMRSLDPHFIEVCRRVRLCNHDGRLEAKTIATRVPRIEAKAAKGNLGDFWTPIEAKEGKALSLSASGFNYKRLSELLFDRRTYDPPAAMKPDPGLGGRWRVMARGVASGQGKTEGYHERTDISFSPRMTPFSDCQFRTGPVIQVGAMPNRRS